MFATLDSGKVLFTLIYVVFSCFSFSLIGCGTDSEIQELRAALERAEKREAEKDSAIQELRAALERVKEESGQQIRGNEQKRVSEREKRVSEREKRVSEREKRVEKLAEKLPHATIKDVRIDRKKKKIDFFVEFTIKNRRDIKCFVDGYFYQRRHSREEFKKLQDEKGSQIFIRGAFTPEDVIDPQTVKLSISYAELNVNQARELRFDAYIFDKVTNSFLNTEPYPKPFRYDPSAD